MTRTRRTSPALRPEAADRSREPARRIALRVSYDGTAFAGFASQTNGRAVADVLASAVAKAYGVPAVRLKGAARTDAGVHALGQVAAFDVPAGAPTIPVGRLPLALKRYLPEDLVVYEAAPVLESWDPVREATGKLYRYQILISPVAWPLLRHDRWQLPRELDVAAMQVAARTLIGRHDFRAFRGAGGAARTSIRTVRALAVLTRDPELWIECEADGFLYRMVRNFVGTLVEVGAGRMSAEEPARVLAMGDRAKAGPTAPAHGLCLVRVDYRLTPFGQRE